MKLAFHHKIILGIVLGLSFGLAINFLIAKNGAFLGSEYIFIVFEYIGKIFTRLLKMVVVPLVFASLFMAIVNLENISEASKMGRKTILYYLLTTSLAVAMGIFVVNLIKPGQVSPDLAAQFQAEMEIPKKVQNAEVGEKPAFEIVIETLVGMIPENVFAAFSSNGSVLQVIFFALFLGLVAVSIPNKAKPIKKVMSSLDALMHKTVGVIMQVAPYFLFFLVASIFMKVGFSILLPLLKYGLTVLSGLLLHALVVLPLCVFVFTRKNPYRLLSQMTTPLFVAWSTASSAATLPVTMKTLDEKTDIKPKVSRFVLPLGATINMDGTALYESVAVIFVAGVLGIDLSLGQQLVIFITASLAAMGAAAIPGAGLVTMGIVLSAVGLPLHAIGIILSIDFLLDQFRTAINVWGDSTAAFVVNDFEERKSSA